jgi:CDP-diacylglycerol--serine O-phosphatidyltransferase
MVSRLRYSHVFNQWFRGQKNRQHVIVMMFSFAAIYMVRELAVPLIFCAFAFAAPLRALWLETVGRRFLGWRGMRHTD